MSLSLSGRRIETASRAEREKRKKSDHSTHSSSSSTSSVRVKLPESNLQRMQASARVVREGGDRRRLLAALQTWKTSCLLKRFLRHKREVLFFFFFYKWLNTRRRKRFIRGLGKAEQFFSTEAAHRFFAALRRQKAQTRVGQKKQRRENRLKSYYKHALKKRMYRYWKAFVKKSRVENSLRNEHQERRSKIKNFLKSMQTDRKATHEESPRSQSKHDYHESRAEEIHDIHPRAPPKPYSAGGSSVLSALDEPEEELQRIQQHHSHSPHQSQSSVFSGGGERDAPSYCSSPRSSISTSPIRSPPRPVTATGPVATRRREGSSRGSCRGVSGKLKPTEDSVKQRRERLKQLQIATQQRVHQKKAEEAELKRRSEEEEEQQVAQQRLEYRSKLSQRIRQNRPQARPHEEADPTSALSRRGAAKASAFYTRQLLLRRGLLPWLALMRESRLDWEKACNFHSDGVLQEAWGCWVGYHRAMKKSRYIRQHKQSAVASSHYHRVLLYRALRGFAKHRQSLQAKSRAVYSQYVIFGACKFAFFAWRVSLEKRRRKNAHLVVKHKQISGKTILRNCFKRWKEYLVEVEFERDIDNRVDATWMKVQEWLS